MLTGEIDYVEPSDSSTKDMYYLLSLEFDLINPISCLLTANASSLIVALCCESFMNPSMKAISNWVINSVKEPNDIFK